MPIIRLYCNISDWEPDFQQLLQCLCRIQKDEISRLKGILTLNDFKLSVVGRLLLRKAVSSSLSVGSNCLTFARDSRNKPVLVKPARYEDPIEAVSFNVSHQGNIAVAVSAIRYQQHRVNGAHYEEVVNSIGVDVVAFNCIKNTRDIVKELFVYKPFFNKEEWIKILHSKEPLKYFCRSWSLREAYVKATGSGLGTNLSSLKFRQLEEAEDTDIVCQSTRLVVNSALVDEWVFEQSYLEKNYCVCVAIKNYKSEFGSDYRQNRQQNSNTENESRREKMFNFQGIEIDSLLASVTPLREYTEDQEEVFQLLKLFF